MPTLDLLGPELDHLAGAQIDEMVVVGIGIWSRSAPALAEIVALDDPGILEQLHRAVDGGDRDAVVDLGAAAIKLLDIGMIGRAGEHARDHAALLGHAHALGDAQRFDVGRLSSRARSWVEPGAAS